MKIPAKLYPCLVLGASLMLAACGNDDDKTGAGSTTITGTAATGAPMSGADIQLLCLNNGTASTTANTLGNFTVRVPTVNLPCAISATPAGGGQSYFSLTSGSGNVTTNVSPLTSLALALAGITPDPTWFAALDNTELQALAAALNAVVSGLNTALSGYGLPANFNPFSSPLLAATSGQAGNDYDRLLEQLQAALNDADQSFASLLASASSGETLTLPTPPRTPGVTSLEEFFTTFAGDYTLEVTNVASEGISAGAAALFPLNSARGVSIKANGDVIFAAVGRTITYTAADYNQDFMGNTSTLNEVRYRTKDGYQWLELYISYDPATGELQLDASGFLANDEGLATLKGPVFIPTEPETVTTCSSGDDKLVFTNGPADFCGFTRSDSANTITNYYQFTSADSTNGVTYVKFDMNSDDSAVLKVTIENDAYAFGCGGALPACTGVTVSSGSSYKQFTLTGTALTVINGASEGITVNGLLIHPVTSGGDDGGSEGSGTLAEQLSSPFAGTYLLSCYSNGSGSALVERTVVINADGSSTLDGNAVISSDHGGQISLRRGATGRYGYEAFYHDPANFKETYFDLSFTTENTLVTDFNRSHSAYVNGVGGSCTGISGPSVGSSAIDMSTLPDLIGSYALTDTLTCSGASAPLPTGLTTVAIDSDGTMSAGSLSLAPSQYVASGNAFTIKDGVTFPGGGFLTPAVISFTVAGDVSDGESGSVAAGIFFRFDKDKNATFVQATRNPATATCSE